MRSLLSRLSRFLDLPPEDRRVVVQAAWLLPVTSLQLRRRGLQAQLDRVEAQGAAHRGEPHRPHDADRAARIALLVAAVARNGVTRGGCLSRSITLIHLLLREGIDADLRLGVRKGADLEAHAWVEHLGRPLNDSADVTERYSPYPAL